MVTTMPHTVNVKAIKSLREKTNASVNDVKEALETAARRCPAPSYGASSCTCEPKALQELRERGAAIAEKRQGRTTGQGRVESYVHHDGRLGAIVEVDCETDFVARTPEFSQFCKDVAMQVAAMAPAQVESLLEQPFVRDQGVTVQDLLKTLIAKTGDNVVIRRFTRFGVGEPG